MATKSLAKPVRVPGWLTDELAGVSPIGLPVIRRRHYVARLAENGKLSLRAIGEIFGVSHTVIRRDIQYAETVWREEYAAQIGSQKAIAVRRYENIIQESYEAWFQSKQEQIEESASKTDLPSGDGKGSSRQTASRKRRQRTGDPRYLDLILKAQSAINLVNGITLTLRSKTPESVGTSPDEIMSTGSEKADQIARMLFTASDMELEMVIAAGEPGARQAAPVKVEDSVFDPDKLPPLEISEGEYIPSEVDGGPQ